ncbi:hypothetical protein L228DRAFT_236070 [Xylona heveae TC161]|uniref:Uncharacterized protein n=1 Tax=Xylona heveae (strain CBS 132557 / TC161) TaxID=1328760 RepID=A0A165IHP8_XYLHT|nr:hypothetical protein L228DRAFT_236070 [Xylona heveae TC161]KZF24912.1 hypothetical protein L228DRAFT_236070 [Xylona heveae TC161]
MLPYLQLSNCNADQAEKCQIDGALNVNISTERTKLATDLSAVVIHSAFLTMSPNGPDAGTPGRMALLAWLIWRCNLLGVRSTLFVLADDVGQGWRVGVSAVLSPAGARRNLNFFFWLWASAKILERAKEQPRRDLSVCMDYAVYRLGDVIAPPRVWRYCTKVQVYEVGSNTSSETRTATPRKGSTPAALGCVLCYRARFLCKSTIGRQLLVDEYRFKVYGCIVYATLI